VAELKALSEMSDSEINFSDIPSLNDAFWKNAVKNTFYRPIKTSTTVGLIQTYELGPKVNARVKVLIRIQFQKCIKLAAVDIGSFVSPNGAQCDSPGQRPGSCGHDDF